MRRFSTRTWIASATAALAAVLLVAGGLGGLSAIGAAFLLAFGRRPKGTGQVAQPDGHETITPATTA
jgi:hypothetical protein